MLKAVLQLTTVPVVLLSSLILTACDSGTDEPGRASSSSSSSVAQVIPTLEIPNVHVQFPPPVSTTQDNVITLRGGVTDTADVSAVLVQGVAVTSDDGLRNWTADVALEAGVNSIEVTPVDAAGEALAPIELQVTRAAQIASPLAMVFDSANDRLLVLDTTYDGVLEVSRVSGARSWFEPGTAAQSLLTDPRGIALDSGNNRLLVYQHDDDAAIVAIDLTSREQSLAELARPEDRLMSYPIGISVDEGTAYVAANETVFYGEDGEPTIDLTSAVTQRTAGMIYASAFGAAEATVLSSVNTPSEEVPLFSVMDLAGDDASDLLYVLDRAVTRNAQKQNVSVYTIKSVNKATGVRQLVFPVTPPQDPTFEEEPVEEEPVVEADPDATGDEGEPPASDSSNEGPFRLLAPRKIALDSANNRLWILDANRFAYLDLANGTVTVAASNDVPEDAQHRLRAASALAVDATNGRIYGADNGYDRILSIDPSSGDREILSSSQTGASGSEEALMLAPGHLSLDPYNERLFVSDRLRANVLVLNMRSGELIALLPEPAAGQGRALQYPLANAYDAATDSLYVFDNFNQWPRLPGQLRSADAPRLVQIDVETASTVVTGFNSGAARFADIDFDENARELFSVQTTGDRYNSYGVYRLEPHTEGAPALVELVSGGSFPDSRNVLRDPRALAVDRARERLLVADAAVNGVLTVDLQSGVREILGDLEQEGAPEFNAPRAIKVDSSGERALVLDSVNDAIVAVDLETGDRSWASQNASDGGILLFNPQDIVLHPVFNYAIVSDDHLDAVIAIDLVTQERVILAR